MASKQDKEQEIINRALRRFSQAEEYESENRAAALEDLRFRIGEQWPEDVKNERELDQQACLTINRIPTFVRQVVNEMRQMRPQIKVRGVDSQSDPETAEIMNGMIRAIEADCSADSAYDYAGEYAVICGFGYWRVTTCYESDESFDQILKIERVRNPFAVFMDPNAQEQDKSDAKWGMVIDVLSKDEFEAKYPKASTMASWTTSTGYLDWIGDDTVRVAEYWEVEEETKTLYQFFDGSTGFELPEGLTEDDVVPFNGMMVPLIVNKRSTVQREVYQYIMTAAEVLEENEWAGKYIPIVEVTGEELVVDGELERCGMVRDMRDPQRMYNYARSQYVDRVSLSPKMPYVGAAGAFDDPNWNRINTANLPYVEYRPVPGEPPPRREAGPDASPGLMAEMQMTAEELKAVTGIYNPGLGDRSNEVSGVAIDSRKLESDIGNFHYLDNLAKGIRYTGKILVDLIPKIYSGTRMVRILGIDGEDEQVQLNQPYVDAKGKERLYQINTGRYDVAVDVGPTYTTQRQEAAASMLEVLKAFPQAASVMGDLYAKNLDWPEADEISKRLKLLLPPEILQDEFPVIGQMRSQMQAQQQQATALITGLQQTIQQLQFELQNRDKELANKVALKMAELQSDQQKTAAELAEDRRQADLDHVEGMTKLELEAQRNLSRAGVGY